MPPPGFAAYIKMLTTGDLRTSMGSFLLLLFLFFFISLKGPDVSQHLTFLKLQQLQRRRRQRVRLASCETERDDVLKQKPRERRYVVCALSPLQQRVARGIF